MIRGIVLSFILMLAAIYSAQAQQNQGGTRIIALPGFTTPGGGIEVGAPIVGTCGAGDIFYNNAGLFGCSTGITASNTTLTIAPATGSVPGLISTQNGTGTSPSTNCGANNVGVEFAFNCVQVLTDTISAAPKSLFGLEIYHYYNGSGATSGNPGAVSGYLEVAGIPGATQNFNATQWVVQADVAAPSGGNLYGFNGYCIITTNATGWGICEGGEIDLKIQSGATVSNKVGFDITSIPGDVVQGTTVDAALVIDAAVSPAPGWKEAIRIGGFNNGSSSGGALSSGAAVLTTYAAAVTTLATGIDLSGTAHSGAGYTYSGNAININTTNYWSGAGAVGVGGNILITGTTLPTIAAGSMVVAGATSVPTLGANGEGVMYLTSGGGWHVAGNGSSNDITIQNSNSANVLTISHAGSTIALPQIASDSGHTDTTVCEDTTSHAFYSGSGTAGICLGNVSSIRFKPDFHLIDDGLIVIRDLDPGLYHYARGISDDDGAQLRTGFTAERYAQIMPEFTRFDAEGRPTGTDMLAALPFAVRAIQQLDDGKADKAEIVTVRAILRDMESKIEKLERRLH